MAKTDQPHEATLRLIRCQLCEPLRRPMLSTGAGKASAPLPAFASFWCASASAIEMAQATPSSSGTSTMRLRAWRQGRPGPRRPGSRRRRRPRARRRCSPWRAAPSRPSDCARCRRRSAPRCAPRRAATTRPWLATNSSSIDFQRSPPVTIEKRLPSAQACRIEASAMPTTGTLADLLERGEAGIAEAGQHDGVLAAAVVGEGIDRGMARDGVADARGDVARPERAGDGAQRRALRRRSAWRVFSTRSVIDCGGVGIDQQDVGHSCMISFSRATSMVLADRQRADARHVGDRQAALLGPGIELRLRRAQVLLRGAACRSARPNRAGRAARRPTARRRPSRGSAGSTGR